VESELENWMVIGSGPRGAAVKTTLYSATLPVSDVAGGNFVGSGTIRVIFTERDIWFFSIFVLGCPEFFSL
jgi:hypothetical protein